MVLGWSLAARIASAMSDTSAPRSRNGGRFIENPSSR
jgi:hypothetical protein